MITPTLMPAVSRVRLAREMNLLGLVATAFGAMIGSGSIFFRSWSSGLSQAWATPNGDGYMLQLLTCE